MENKQLTLGSLFDGSGGFPLAGKLAGIKPVWASEVEPFPIAVTHKRLPEMKHYGDVSAISGADLEPVDIITGGFPCFPTGTLVLTDKGYIEIENVRVGMKVLTHMGRWRKVTATGSKEGETIVLKGNHYGLECTPNHPIYSAEMKRYYLQLGNGKRSRRREVRKEKEWTAAEKMKDKLWAVPNTFEMIPIDQPRYSEDCHEKPMPEFSEDFFYLVGRWLGYGWVSDNQRTGRPEGQRQSRIVICTRHEKKDALKAAMKTVIDRYKTKDCGTTIKYKFGGRVFCNWLTENFGNYAYEKRIPSWVYSMSKKWRVALLKGICDTNSYLTKSGRMRITAISKKLAHGIRLLAETLGYSSTVHFSKRLESRVIEGKPTGQRDIYIVNLTHSKMWMQLVDELHTWYKVVNIKNTGERKTVYNITVEEDNSYIADDIVVHNCQDVSVAGKRAGLAGKRTGLFYEAIRIIKEMREKTNGQYPRFFIAENVPGIYSSNGGEDFRAILEEIIKIAEPEAPSLPMPSKEGWPYADVILGDGWSLAYRTLDAQYFGVAQRRRRMFLVADFRDRSAGEILFKSEGLSGYTPQGFRVWQGTSGDSPQSIGETSSNREGRIVLNDQGGSRMDVTNDVTCTRRAESSHPPCVMDGAANAQSVGYEDEVTPAVIPLEHHPADSRIKIAKDEIVQTLNNRMGTGGNNVPLLMEEQVSIDQHQSCYWDGGQIAGTLTRRNADGSHRMPDKGNFNCVLESDELQQTVFGICSYKSNAMLSDNPRAGIYEAETTRTLDATGGNPSCHQGGVCVVEQQTIAFTQNQRSEVRDLGDKSGALQAQPGMKQQTYVLQENVTTMDDNNDSTTVELASKSEVHYMVRRLTPTECARLQGFPDWWCHDLGNPNPTDEELKFWMDVWETHRKVVSHNTKPKTEKQVRKWLADPYSDSAEYRLWGNGVALPCVYFIMCGIVWVAEKE